MIHEQLTLKIWALKNRFHIRLTKQDISLSSCIIFVPLPFGPGGPRGPAGPWFPSLPSLPKS